MKNEKEMIYTYAALMVLLKYPLQKLLVVFYDSNFGVDIGGRNFL
jgi:hypothetical protein